MNLLMEAALSCPPSEVYAVRSLMLCVCTFSDYDTIVVLPAGDVKDAYYQWFKDKYLMDYVTDFAEETDILHGRRLGVDRITCNNLHAVLASLGVRLTG